MSSNNESGSYVTSSGPRIDSGAMSAVFVIGMFVLGGAMIRTGYRLGIDAANRVLRRHDKTVRILKKEARRHEKELKKERERARS